MQTGRDIESHGKGERWAKSGQVEKHAGGEVSSGLGLMPDNLREVNKLQNTTNKNDARHAIQYPLAATQYRDATEQYCIASFKYCTVVARKNDHGTCDLQHVCELQLYL